MCLYFETSLPIFETFSIILRLSKNVQCLEELHNDNLTGPHLLEQQLYQPLQCVRESTSGSLIKHILRQLPRSGGLDPNCPQKWIHRCNCFSGGDLEECVRRENISKCGILRAACLGSVGPCSVLLITTSQQHNMQHLTNNTNLNLIVLGNMGNYWGNFGYPRYDQHSWKIVHFPYPLPTRMQLVRNIMPFPSI